MWVRSSRAIPVGAAWKQSFEALKAFNEEHGHFRLSKKQPRQKSLSHWVDHQRACFKKETLSTVKINLLNSIGFVWSPRKTKKIN
ncbi:helicase associated domain-containing protein [uncultured Microscilla sp.]|uniref:helicase associated domain-containing protein n=1 Tax=uncultured Microscilla sp. TaxID=432653 RepID=UPI002604233E|nr:helicase associated domain-containing protein [uncultured Microscilla sp.]